MAAHQKTYVLAGGDEEYEDPESARPVNWNSAAVDEFVQSLIQAASKARSLYEERYYPQRSEQQDLSTEKLHLLPLMKWALWPAPGSADTELGVLMELEVSHGETEVYTRVQA